MTVYRERVCTLSLSHRAAAGQLTAADNWPTMRH